MKTLFRTLPTMARASCPMSADSLYAPDCSLARESKGERTPLDVRPRSHDRAYGITTLMSLLLGLFMLCAASGTARAQSSACDMLSFTWGSYSGTFTQYDDDLYGVEVKVPFGTDISAVSPTITVSPGATVVPASGEEIDFETEEFVIYVVTAENGTDQKFYEVSFVESFPTADMLSMHFGATPATIGPVVNNTSYVTILMPSGTDVTNLAPTYTLSSGATGDPPSGSTQDFTNAVEYTVLSSDGFESKTYVVMVSVNDPIFVGADGVGPILFTKRPPASSWATLSVAGAAGDISSTGQMDTAMNAINGSSISNVLSNFTGTASATAYWRPGDLKLGTQPTGNRMTLLKASLKNVSGGTLGGITVSYDLGAVNTPNEQIIGHRVYWSKTGAAGSWTAAGTFGRTSPGTGRVEFDLELTAGWAANEMLYIVWADDNGTPTQGNFTIDQVAFDPIPPSANILTFNVAGVAATISGTEIALVAPPGVDVSNLTPTFTLSYGAQSNPLSGVARDFSNPVFYTVTSSDSQVTKVYSVTIVSSYWTQGLLAEFFDFNVGYGQLPDMSGMTPDVTRIDEQINYPSTNNAWPGLPASMADTFGSRHTGAIRIDTPGTYTFYLESDDGSKMWLNGALLIDNDGLHGMQERQGTVNLAAGYHPFRIEFFENTGGAGLIFRWAGPGIAKQVVPAHVLFRLGSATTSTTTELTSTPNPSLTGQNVTFTATLRRGASVATAATGTYAFRRNGVVIAVVPLVNGVATYSTTTLPSGSLLINATYSGDNIYRPSEATITQINNTPVTLTVNGGSGGGTYISGDVVSIVANPPAQGKAFDGWIATSGNPVIDNPSSANTTLTMPPNNVTVAATYRDVPPAGITALAWYDASDPETISLISGSVSQWKDKSGNGYHAVQTSSSLRPTVETGGLRFGIGTANTHMDIPVMAQDARTVMMVMKNDINLLNTSGAQMPLSLLTYSAGPAFGSATIRYRDEVVSMFDEDVAFTNNNTQSASNAKLPSISNNPHIYSFVLTENWHIGFDGSADLKDLTNGSRHPIYTSQFGGGIGADVRQKASNNTIVRRWTGLISEIILVSNAVTPLERQKIEGYLAHKWDAINGNNLLVSALPAGHPYKASPPTNNTPPVAIAQSVTTEYATDKPITLTGNDPDGDALSYSIVAGPQHGSLAGIPPNVIYTPSFGFSGADSFTFKVSDGQADSEPATVSITVEQGDPYQEWVGAGGYDLAGGPDHDDDGDGMSNFAEFAFGLDPTDPASSNPILTPLDKATHSFTYTRYAYSGLVYTVWTSTDLDYWGVGPVEVNETLSEPDENGVVTVQVTLALPPVGNTNLFVRVMATAP
jgi:hypothetical protein